MLRKNWVWSVFFLYLMNYEKPVVSTILLIYLGKNYDGHKDQKILVKADFKKYP